MEKEISNTQRIDWIDIFKGLLMILVVLGHATGKFNMFIYQFHVGAFFLISGYVSKEAEGNPLKCIGKKGYALLVPIVTVFIIFAVIMQALNEVGLYHYFFQGDYVGLSFLFSQLVRGNIYIPWLGAAWFVIVLFGIYLLWETVSIVYKNGNIVISMIISLLLGALGVITTAYETDSMTFRLILVTQFIFMCGRFCAEKKFVSRIDVETKTTIEILLCNILLFWYLAKQGYTMDIASGKWPNPIIAIVMILNGSIFLYLVSKWIADSTSALKNVLIYIGRNTLGILVFHFAAFKVAYLILYAFGAIPKQDIALLCPTEQVGNEFWWLIVIVSIGLSLFAWEVLKHFKVTRIFIGQDRSVGNLLGQKLDIRNTTVKNILTYGWVIYMVVFCVQQVNPQILYNEMYLKYTNECSCVVAGMYEDNFLGKAVNVRYIAVDDAVMNIQLYQTEHTKGNRVRVFIDGECQAEYPLVEGSNQIQILVKAAREGKVQLMFEKSFIPAEVSESSDVRELTCKLVDIKIKSIVE